VPKNSEVGAGPIDHIYGWAPSYKTCLWLLRARRSCNQRTRPGHDRGSGACHTPPGHAERSAAESKHLSDGAWCMGAPREAPIHHRTRLRTPEKPVVLMVMTDPEPHDVASVKNPQSAIVDAHTHRKHRAPPAYPLEIQTGVVGIGCEEEVGLSGLALHVVREVPVGIPEAPLGKRPHAYSSSVFRGSVRPARCSDSASSARRSRNPSDSELSNSSDHRRSDSNSASRKRASLSCSACGSSAAFSNAS